jgi:WD40 repeat protein
MTLEGHAHRVRAVALTPDGRRAVTGGEDETAKVWDLETGACLLTLEGHTHRVWAVAVTPDGRRAVTRSLDRTIGLWDLETGQEVACLIGEGPMRGCAVGPNGAIVAGDEAGNVYLLELVE